jgi:hypothetical protein
MRDHALDALKQVYEQLPPEVVIVCEATGLRSTIRPGLFLLVTRDSDDVRLSAQRVGHLADRMVRQQNGQFDLKVSAIQFEEGRWCCKD